MNDKSSRINFNLFKYILLCFKSWRVFAVCILCCVIFAGIISVVQTPKSQVMAQLMLKDDAGGGSSMMLAGQIARSFSLGDMFGGSSSTDNETFVLSSHAVMIGTVKDLELNTSYFQRKWGIKWQPLYSNSPFRLIVPDQMSDTITVALVFNVKCLDDGRINVAVKAKRKTIAESENMALPATVSTPYGDFIIDKTPSFDSGEEKNFKIQYCSYSSAAQSLMEIVKIYVPDRKTDFIDLALVTTEPKHGIKVLNSIIDNYIEVSNLYKFGRTTQTLNLVDNRLATLSKDMADSERGLEKFKMDNKLTDVEVDAQYLITKTGNLEASLLEAQTNYELLKLTKDYISNPENKYSLIPELVAGSSSNNANDNGLISTYNQMILQRMELLNSAKTNSNAVRQLDEQIDAMRDNIVTSVDRMYINASVALRDIKNEEGRTKSRISELPTIEREYITLKRDNMLMEQMYLFLLQQREELEMNVNSTSLPAQVVDAPYVVDKEPGLSRMMLLALGVFLGFVFAALYVLLFKMKKSPAISADEINAILEAPRLQPIYLESKGAQSFAIDGLNSETFRQLRSDVQFALNSCNGKVIAVTSMNGAEGKTFVAVNLAISLAAIGKNTLLIDAALRNPNVAPVLGVDNPVPALADFVMSTKNPSAIDVKPVMINGRFSLDVLTATQKAVNAADIVASDRFAKLIEAVKSSYDYVIIDSSAVKGYSDIYHITDVADITLMVCRVNVVTPEDISQINTLYSDGRLKRLAVIENGVK